MAEKQNVKVIFDTCKQLTEQVIALDNSNNEVSEDLLKTLKSAFSDIIQYLKFYLVQCQNKFYGTLLMDLDLVVDFNQRGAIDLSIETTPYKIKINPLFCKDYKFNEFVGLVVNEINKMIWLHPAIFAETNSEKDPQKHFLLEAASDVNSTNIIKHDQYLIPTQNSFEQTHKNGVRIPEDRYTVSKMMNDLKINVSDNESLNYYYTVLTKIKNDQPLNFGQMQQFNQNQNQNSQGSQKQQNNKQNQNGQNGQGNGDPSQNQQQPNNQNQNQNSQGGQNGQQVATPQNGKGEQTHQWEGSDTDEIKETVTSLVSNALNSMDDESRGFLPGGLAGQIKKLLEAPEIDWKGILRKMVGSVPVPYRKTRTRLNRRLPYRADLSGRLPKRVVNVVCCFDTSGSMSDEDLRYCMNEVFNIVKVYEGYKVTIIECDAAVQKVYQAKRMEDLQLKMRGRGGTSFVPAIEFINGEGKFSDNKSYPLAGKFKDALMVYFTDGYGDYEIPKPRTFRNLWVVLHDVKNLSLKEPYGDVKSLSMDEKWKKMKGR